MIKLTTGSGEEIEIQPNTVEFEMGGPKMFGASGFEFRLRKSRKNIVMVRKWEREGVDSAELSLVSGDVYTLIHPGMCTATVDFDSFPGEIFVKIEAGRAS